MDFDLRLLRHARALAEEGSFARAARTLHLTQPALSRSIQELERRTGIKLFERSKGRVEPTDLGRVFVAHARELLGRAEALDREIEMLRGAGTGKLVIGSGTLPSGMFVPAAVGAFLRRNPDVGIRVVNDNWVALVAALRRRELDFIVAAPPSGDDASGLVTQLLSPWQGYFLVRPGHPLLARRGVTLADVVAHPIICTGRLPAPLATLLLAARANGSGGIPLPAIACESNEMMRHLAAATDHVLLSTLAAHAAAIAAGDLTPLPVVDPRIGVTFAIIRLEARTLPPIAADLMRDIVAADRAAFARTRQLVVPEGNARDVASGHRTRGAQARRAGGGIPVVAPRLP
jgi:DNA-binding transcriptional LysR family regulator